MTDKSASHGDQSPTNRSPSLAFPSDLPLRIPKNKSTGNLLLSVTQSPVSVETRTRFSFDAGAPPDGSSLKRVARIEHDNGLGITGLRRIRRAGPPSRQSTLVFDEPDFIPPSLIHAQTAPASAASSRTVSRSASAAFLASTPVSPVLDDLHRFPSESLHSFSFARRTEESLHSRQNILQKSVDFMRDRNSWAANASLMNAQARVSGDAEIQGMMDLLQRAKVVPSLDIGAATATGAGLGPMTGPAQFEGPNIFEKSFSRDLDTMRYSPRTSMDQDDDERRRGSLATEDGRFTQAQKDDFESIPKLQVQPPPRRSGLKRTYTDVNSISLQQKLIEALAQPYSSEEPPQAQGKNATSFGQVGSAVSAGPVSAVHGSGTKWVPPAQAVFRTSAEAPWTIVAANDLACLAFGVTRAEVRNLSILGIIQEERRSWLEEKLRQSEPVEERPKSTAATHAISHAPSLLLGSKGGGITARLLSKAPSRVTKSKADFGPGGNNRTNTAASPTINNSKNHPPTKSRGVLLCGDIVPIRKRDGTPGAASFWVMEKRGGLIWVVEEITEDVAFLKFNDAYELSGSKGDVENIWGEEIENGLPLSALIPKLPEQSLEEPGYQTVPITRYFTASTMGGVSVPVGITNGSTTRELRISSLPHMAGVMIIDPGNLKITSSNSVFSGALFGYENPGGLLIDTLIPGFSAILDILTEEDDHDLVDGLVVPEHSFRKARALLALREGKETAASIFLRPAGLIAKHRDESEIMIDVQMRVVRSETVFPVPEDVIIEEQEDVHLETSIAVKELVYAIWITYSRSLHSAGFGVARPEHPLDSRPVTPPSQPLPSLPSPPPTVERIQIPEPIPMSLSQNLHDVSPAEPIEHPPLGIGYVPHEKKTINDFTILEEMGKGAYGEVKLARYKTAKASKVVLKYVVKRRILVDTWTRDRRLGTIPLEIHVLDFLRSPSMRHPNIVEMIDFFEDSNNYYIEMLPHGLPGMDLFDYIELRANMEEVECQNIFRQVTDAVHHLHVKAKVVHRDIKDENVVLDGEGNIKLIDFGSATYIRNGPFDVFVGTLDYAAPEVLQGKPYGGTEQDVWALGILLYTLAYRENPFYNIDEILDHPLRIPYIPFSESCIDLIKRMLDRDVEERITIEQVLQHEWLTVVD